MECKHDESRPTQDQRCFVDRHDCGYVDAINALIPRAVKVADAIYGDVLKSDDKKAVTRAKQRWDQVYFAAMDELALQAGLRTRGPGALDDLPPFERELLEAEMPTLALAPTWLERAVLPPAA